MSNIEILITPLLENHIFLGLSLFHKYPFEKEKPLIVGILPSFTLLAGCL